jgi:hypothetical protein
MAGMIAQDARTVSALTGVSKNLASTRGVGDRSDQSGGPNLEVVEKAVYVVRRGDYTPPLYWIAVDGFDSVLVKEHLLGHVLGLIFGADAAEPLREIVHGTVGQLKAWPWLNPPQLMALDELLAGYRALRE